MTECAWCGEEVKVTPLSYLVQTYKDGKPDKYGHATCMFEAERRHRNLARIRNLRNQLRNADGFDVQANIIAQIHALKEGSE